MTTKESNNLKWGHKFLLFFFISVFLQKADMLLFSYTGIYISAFFGGTLLILPPIFIFLSCIHYLKYKQSKIYITKNLKYKIYLLVGYIFLLTIYGFINNNLSRLIFIDLWPYFIIIPSMYLGAIPLVWDKLYKPLVILYVIFFIIVWLAKDKLRLHYVEGGYTFDSFSNRITVKTLAYEMAPILEFWPLIFTLSFFVEKSKAYKILGFISAFLFVGLQIYFLKRAPVVRGIIHIFLVLLFYQKIFPFSIKSLKTIFAIIIISLFVVSLLSVEDLINRFKSEDSSRQSEARIMLSQLDIPELLVGKGLGGYFFINDSQGTGIIEVNQSGKMGKAVLHIGIFYFILKGGLMYVLFILWLSSSIFFKWKNTNWLTNPYNFTAMLSLSTYLLFRLIEGPFTTGAIFQAFMFGLCIGRISSSKTQYKKYILI